MSTVIVGASLAGLRAAEALRREGHAAPITVVGAETHRPYDRPPLSKQLLAGTWTRDRVDLRQAEDLAVEWRLGVAATGLSLASRTVALADGTTLPFDELVIATGSVPRSLPGTEHLDGVFVLRTVDDALALAAALDERPSRVCVVGAGFIGAEVASTARGRGLDVTVVEALPMPLGRVLGDELGAVCAQLHAAAGTDLRVGVGVDHLDGDSTGRVRAVHLADGTVVEASVVVVGIGVRPATDWLAGSGLQLDDGVVSDAWCRALDDDGAVVPGVVAAGDVARWRNDLFGELMRVEHWTNAAEQAEAAAATLVHGGGDPHPPYAPVPYFWSDQYGHKLQHLGHNHPGDEMVIVDRDAESGRFVAAYGRAGVTVAAFSFDWPARLMPWRQRILDRAPFPPVR